MNFYFSFRAICFQKFDFYQFALKNKSFMHTCLLYICCLLFGTKKYCNFHFKTCLM